MSPLQQRSVCSVFLSLLACHLTIQALCSERKEVCYLGNPPDYKEQTEQIV